MKDIKFLKKLKLNNEFVTKENKINEKLVLKREINDLKRIHLNLSNELFILFNTNENLTKNSNLNLTNKIKDLQNELIKIKEINNLKIKEYSIENQKIINDNVFEIKNLIFKFNNDINYFEKLNNNLKLKINNLNLNLLEKHFSYLNKKILNYQLELKNEKEIEINLYENYRKLLNEPSEYLNLKNELNDNENYLKRLNSLRKSKENELLNLLTIF